MEENINVEVLKTLYNQEKDKLKELKEKLDEAFKKRELLQGDLDFLRNQFSFYLNEKTNIHDEQRKLYDKIERKESILTFTLLILIIFSSLVLGVCSTGLIATILGKVLRFIGKINQLSICIALVTTILSGIGVTIVIFRLLAEKIMEKIDMYIESSKEKLINSEQYRGLESLKSAADEQVRNVGKDLYEAELREEELKISYDELNEQYKKGKEFVDYLDRQINPTEMTTSLSRGLRNDIN